MLRSVAVCAASALVLAATAAPLRPASAQEPVSSSPPNPSPSRSPSPAAVAPALAPTGPSASTDGEVNDPFEKVNRVSFLVGGALDVVIIRPVAIFYGRATPRPVRKGLSNIVANLGEPVNVVNRTLQLKPTAAARTLGRFAINSTFGLGGLFDIAQGSGLKAEPTSFGQTLSRYGVAQGPYLFVPVLGPTTVRDGFGRIVDIFADPIDWVRFRDDVYFFTARSVIPGLDARYAADPALKEIQRTATDPYAAIRAAYIQNASFLENGGKVDVKALPDFGPEPAKSPRP